MNDIKLGPLEQLMLLAVMRLGDNAYGVTIQKKIEGVTGKPLSVPLLYTTLSRLVEKGVLSDRLGPPTRARGGKPKRLYRVNARGEAALKQADIEERKRAEALRGLVEAPGRAQP